MAEANHANVANLHFEPEDAIARLGESLLAARDDGAHCVCLALSNTAGEAPPGSLRWLELFPLPIVAAFEDELTGCAAAVALACDIRVCGENASLAAPADSNDRLRLLVRDAPVLGRLQAGERVAARELEACALVGTMTEAGQAVIEAQRIAGVIAARGPIAVRLAKEAIWRGLEMPMEQALRFETDLTLLLQTTNDRAEGVRAFLEKRAPRFTGD